MKLTQRRSATTWRMSPENSAPRPSSELADLWDRMAEVPQDPCFALDRLREHPVTIIDARPPAPGSLP